MNIDKTFIHMHVVHIYIGILWSVEGIHSDGKPFIGSEDNLTTRRNLLTWMVDAMFDRYNRMNTCFALIDRDTNQIAAATITVNNTGKRHNLQGNADATSMNTILYFLCVSKYHVYVVFFSSRIGIV